MKKDLRIYCIEGHWDYGNRQVEPSVEPMLKLLQGMDLWNYARRDCATIDEMIYFIDAEWARCNSGSILYVATHGKPGVVFLSEQHPVTVEQLALHLEDQCGDCLVHFGGCKVMAAPESRLRDFMEKTGAMGVSVTPSAGWTSAVAGRSSQAHPPPWRRTLAWTSAVDSEWSALVPSQAHPPWPWSSCSSAHSAARAST